MQAKNSISINRLERVEIGEVVKGYTDRDVETQMNHLNAQMEELEVVTRLQKEGKFSGRHKEQDGKDKCNKYT